MFNNQTFYETNWKGIFVSNYGDVISFRQYRNLVDYNRTPKILTKQKSIAGYDVITITIRNNNIPKTSFIFVHHLVAETFLGSKPDNCTVDHINNDQLDNRPENLQYITQQENVARRYQIPRKGNNNKMIQKFNIIIDGVDNVIYGVSNVKKLLDIKEWSAQKLVKNLKTDFDKFVVIDFKLVQETIQITIKTKE